ncbi:FkbM family methyltransferase [Roseiconus nitratireducens]|uniref:FkbM family methyltransferase n=1 Tax=Roseiconus nitratireducens TaxID=2605748 RepID=A0A5M6D8E4_9BACT|nr:FkbM family methyltransferase [Roseiconus nitratireducens]KAA5543814.1 FkbM family methyltransferase [Roseiconus nitratireducens]
MVLKTALRSLLATCGLELRLTRNVNAAHVAAKRQAVIDRWKLLQRYDPKCVLDLGANEGQFAKIVREILPGVPIYSFEPLDDCFQKLESFLQSSGPGQAFPFALGAENGQATIHRSEFSPSSSLLEMGELHAAEFPATAKTYEQTIQIKRLDDAVEKLPLTSPLVMKVDVQGFENDVIAGAPQTLQRTTAAVIELTSYPLYRDQSTFESVQNQMAAFGFVFRGVVDQMHSPRDGRILQFDALFENSALVDQPANVSASRNRSSCP